MFLDSCKILLYYIKPVLFLSSSRFPSALNGAVCFHQEEVRLRGESIISKMKHQYQRSAMENTVMSSQLNSPELLKLTGQPGRLIVALFEHSSVEERMRNPAGQSYPGEQHTHRSQTSGPPPFQHMHLCCLLINNCLATLKENCNPREFELKRMLIRATDETNGVVGHSLDFVMYSVML